MSAINISIGHNNHFVVPAFTLVIVIMDACSKGGNHGLYFLIHQDFIHTAFFHIENFTSQRQDCLCPAVSPLFCRTTCGITFYQEDFANLRVFGRTIGQLTRNGRLIGFLLISDSFFCFAGGFSGHGCLAVFLNNFSCIGGILFKIPGDKINGGI